MHLAYTVFSVSFCASAFCLLPFGFSSSIKRESSVSWESAEEKQAKKMKFVRENRQKQTRCKNSNNKISFGSAASVRVNAKATNSKTKHTHTHARTLISWIVWSFTCHARSLRARRGGTNDAHIISKNMHEHNTCHFPVCEWSHSVWPVSVGIDGTAFHPTLNIQTLELLCQPVGISTNSLRLRNERVLSCNLD